MSRAMSRVRSASRPDILVGDPRLARRARGGRRGLAGALMPGLFLGGLVATLGGCVRSDITLGARDTGSALIEGGGPGDGTRPEASSPDAQPLVPDGCPPPPTCNWCNGTPLQDALGCVIGYRCANGADPCLTPACIPATGSGCAPDETCAADGLCWPRTDAGTAGTFKCGALLTCQLASEYCQSQVPSTCGSMPLPDGGICPTNCKAVTCGTTPMCQCNTYTCQPLPGGCAACSCLPLGANCTCVDVSPGLLVKCPI